MIQYGCSLLVLLIQRYIIGQLIFIIFLLAVINKFMQGYLTSISTPHNHNLASLQYELSLLKERNKILAMQNEELVNKIQETQHRLSEMQKKLNLLQRQQVLSAQSKNKEKQQVYKLIKVLQQNFRTNDQQFVDEMYRNNCPTYSIIQNLITIVKQYGQNKQNRSNLNRLQKLVNKRKQRILEILPRNREIVHIVKQPITYQVVANQADLQFIVTSAEKIIRKVKKVEVKNEGISNVMDRLVNLIYLRKSIRQEEKNLNIMEREIELGVGCRMAFEEITTKLIQMRKEELESKHKIQKLIFQL